MASQLGVQLQEHGSAEDRISLRNALAAYSIVVFMASASTYLVSCAFENFEHLLGFGFATFDVLHLRLNRWWLQLLCLTAMSTTLSLSFQRLWRGQGTLQDFRVEGSDPSASVSSTWKTDFAEVSVVVIVVYFVVNVVFSFLTSLAVVLNVMKPDLNSWLVGLCFTASKFLTKLTVRPILAWFRTMLAAVTDYPHCPETRRRDAPDYWRSVVLRDLICCAAFDVLAPLALFTIKNLMFWAPNLQKQSGGNNNDEQMDHLIHASFAAFILSVLTSELTLTLKFFWRRCFDFSGEVRKLCTCAVFSVVISVVNPTMLVVGALSAPVMSVCCWLRYIHSSNSFREEAPRGSGNDLMIMFSLPGRLWYSSMFFAVMASQYDRIARFLHTIFANPIADDKYKEEVNAALADFSVTNMVQAVVMVCIAYMVLGLIPGALSGYIFKDHRPLERGQIHAGYPVILCGVCPITSLWTCTSDVQGQLVSLCRGGVIATALILFHFAVCFSGGGWAQVASQGMSHISASGTAGDLVLELMKLLFGCSFGWSLGVLLLVYVLFIFYKLVKVARSRCCPRRQEEAVPQISCGGNPGQVVQNRTSEDLLT